MQQEFNRKYESYIGLIPCDGVYGRSTNSALIYAYQAEEGLPVGVANGNFGPTTRKCAPNIPYTRSSGAALTYNLLLIRLRMLPQAPMTKQAD